MLNPDDWTAVPIGMSSRRQGQDRVTVLLRKDFEVRPGLTSARLYVTAQGLHRTCINGVATSQDLLEPGWTEYRSRLLYSSYDVTHTLIEGTNTIGAVLADGWWRGNLTWIPNREVYGSETAYLAQLELSYEDGRREIIATDKNWKGSFGGILSADLYNGSSYDASQEPAGWMNPGFDDVSWIAATAQPMRTRLQQRSMPTVRVIERREADIVRADDRSILIDCGQNLTGWVQLEVDVQQQTEILIRHAEVLEPDGALHLSSLRTAEATDRYRMGPGRHFLEPDFTYHGFRYAQVELGEGAELLGAQAVVVASDLSRIGHFRCSDERVNKLYENIVWSQRGNFLSIPTDCPQRDERLGWTGDIQVFAPTACANFDCRAFLGSWLEDLAAEQREDGNVPSTVPNVIWGHPYEYGGIGWGDAATLVPWAVYEAYGDRSVLTRQFDSMKAWVDYGLSRLDSDGLWTGDFHLGDWLDPGAPPGHPELATTDRDFIASSYLSFSAGIVAKSAALLGKSQQAAHYAEAQRSIATATWLRWQEQLRQTQTGCAMAIEFGIAPDEERAGLGVQLGRLVKEAGAIRTGFLGTPLILPALTRTGQFEAASKLLLGDTEPGWLYQVRMGATTVWERWDAIRPDGSIHKGDLVADDSPGMMSFNHYAYGAVGAWLYRSLAGIAPAAPGYARIAFQPFPLAGIDSAEASIETPFGRAAISWQIKDDTMHVRCETPPGTESTFSTPPGWLVDSCENDANSQAFEVRLSRR